MAKAQIKLLKADMKVHYSKARESLQVPGDTKNKTLQAVMVLMFLIGMINMYRGMKWKLVKKGLVLGMRAALARKGIDVSSEMALKFNNTASDVIAREVPNPELVSVTLEQLDALEAAI
jgi:hypothetical protein